MKRVYNYNIVLKDFVGNAEQVDDCKLNDITENGMTKNRDWNS